MRRFFVSIAAVFAVSACGSEEASGPVPTEGVVALSDQFTGDFELIDKNGEAVTDEDFEGKVMLVYFGFTHCPDVCPGDINVMSAALNALGNEAGEVAPVFISVDPERDTVKAMAEYVGYFHPAIRGWTGPEAQIARAAEGVPIVHAGAHVGGGGNPHRMQQFLRAQESHIALGGARGGDHALDQRFGGIDEHAGRLARTGQALDPATFRIGGGRAYACRFERQRIAPGGMAVHPAQPDGPIGHRTVEFRSGREATEAPFLLIPAAAQNPRAGGIFGSESANLIERFFQRIGIR